MATGGVEAPYRVVGFLSSIDGAVYIFGRCFRDVTNLVACGWVDDLCANEVGEAFTRVVSRLDLRLL